MMAKRGDSHVLAARQHANELRQAEARALRRRRAVKQALIIGAAVILVGAVVTVTIVMSRAAGVVAQPEQEAAIVVDGAADVRLDVKDDRVRVGSADAPVTLSLYEDFSCPHCQDYEALVGDTLTSLVATGDVAVEYHPIRIVTNYGMRAGSAAACVAVGDPNRWLDVHAGLFALHDASTDTWSNDQFRDYLAEEGVSDESVLACVADGDYEKWIGENTETARTAGVNSTPTLRVNGEESELLSPDQLRATVDRLVAEQ